MGLNTLTNRAAGQTILDTFFNDIHQAMNTDFIGRDAVGVPTSGQNLGTTAFPWGIIRADSLVLDGSSVDTSQITSPQNRIISGKTRSTSDQPAFIVPNGAAASFLIDGTPTNLVVDINGVTVSITTDITKSGLTLAPASNNTCLLNDADAAAQEDTRLWGEYGHRKSLIVDAMGSNITALVGKWASFKVVGTATEYLFAFVKSSTELTHVFRGYFYDSSSNPINRTKLTDNDTFTLMSTAWVFVSDDAVTVDVTYNNPVWSFTAPSGPATGDYWKNLGTQQWYRFDGASWVIIDRTFVGIALVDTANCVAARCEHFFANFDEAHDMEFEVATTEIIRASEIHRTVNVYGNEIEFGASLPTWNISTAQLVTTPDAYAAEAASTLYYLYVKNTGEAVLSDISPYFRPDFKGWYHPHNPWRCVASTYNNASSNLDRVGSYGHLQDDLIHLHTGNGTGAVYTKTLRFTTAVYNRGTGLIYLDDANGGGTFTCSIPGRYTFSAGHRAAGGTLDGGIAINLTAAEATTAPQSITAANRLGYIENIQGVITASYDLKIGDVIRSVSGASPTTSVYFTFIATRNR